MEDVTTTTSQLVAMGAVWSPWWLMSVTLLRDVMKTMTIKLLVQTTLLMPPRLFGKTLKCVKTTGEA
jgi:hypothetical protein